MKMLLTWHGAREHEVFGKSAGDPELEIRAQELRLPANRIRGYRELRVRARGHVELPLGFTKIELNQDLRRIYKV